MKLWKNNRLDKEWELSNEEILQKFKQSKFHKIESWPWDRCLIAFITDPKDGLASVFDSDDFEKLLDDFLVDLENKNNGGEENGSSKD